MGEPTGHHVFCSYRAHFGNNAPSSDTDRPDTLHRIPEKCATSRSFVPRISWLLAFCTALGACNPAAVSEPSAAAPAPVSVAAEEEPILHCGNDGQLSTEIYGAITTRLEWNKNDLECSGMPRPNGRGARLRFAGITGGEERHIAIIVALPDLVRDARGDEFKSNVTLIEEGQGRFFSTPDIDNCLTDITSLVALDDSGDRYSISGVLYCLSPLPQVNGASSVSIPELRFSGLIDWSSS